ncbi:hypothetical protein [Nonomuraea sediminis]|uniref:hypothetical protein n=1 Tax=Nonomuraea sediminis TaxID=2835864 RepID=UPI001BDBD34C|nr:hypothetical protein [Nonomuraea sediminis]
MYAWLWRKLPGKLAVKLLLTAVLLAVVVAVLWYAVFPLLEPAVPLDEVTVKK